MKKSRAAPTAGCAPVDPTHQNVKMVAKLEQAAQTPRSTVDGLIDRLTRFVGSIGFLYLQLLWFLLWPLVNVLQGPRAFDPYPFFLLVALLAMEAILLSTLILMSQNRQQRLADRRAHLDLQVNLLAEQETTKILAMLDNIQQHLGIAAHDPVVQAMKEATEPERLVEQIEEHVGGQEKVEKAE
jgi:uncharacterized membrane protein